MIDSVYMHDGPHFSRLDASKDEMETNWSFFNEFFLNPSTRIFCNFDLTTHIQFMTFGSHYVDVV